MKIAKEHVLIVLGGVCLGMGTGPRRPSGFVVGLLVYILVRAGLGLSRGRLAVGHTVLLTLVGAILGVLAGGLIFGSTLPLWMNLATAALSAMVVGAFIWGLTYLRLFARNR